MSDIDLIGAIAPREWDVSVWPPNDGGYVTGSLDVADRKRLAGLIERQVREQVAREIEDLEHDRDEMRERLAQGLSATWAAGYDNAVHDAARIARGEQP